MLGGLQRTQRVFDVVPAALVVERTPHGGGDERTSPTLANAFIQIVHDLIIETYVQTHGHSLAHSFPRSRIYDASRATDAITFESWLPCQAIGERPGLSVTRCAPGIASA